MNVQDHSDSPPLPFVTHGVGRPGERTKAHLMAYLLFSIGAIYAWLGGGHISDPDGVFCVFAIIWFPAILVEMFRRSGMANYGMAAALISGICGYDGIYRLLHPFNYGGGC